MANKLKLIEKLKELFEETIESDILKYDGKLNNIDHFGLFCKATSNDKLYKICGCNVCVYNYIYNEDDSVMFIYSIPNGIDTGSKKITDKIMEIITIMEKCFIVLDYVDTNYIKDDKFLYLIIIKKIRR